MTKVQKEAELYKNLPIKKLKKTIREYKFLSFANSKNFNFIFTLSCLFLPYFIFFGVDFNSLLILVSIHYFFLHKYMFEKRGWKLVSDKDKEEIDEIVQILENSLKERQTKNPSK